MKKTTFLVVNILVVSLFVFDYVYSSEIHSVLWGLFIIPGILLIRRYPNWRLTILIGFLLTTIKYSVLLSEYQWQIPTETLFDSVISTVVNWSLLIGFSALFIKNAKMTKDLNRSQEEVNNQKLFLETILNNMEEQVISCDAVGKINYMNQAAHHFKAWEGFLLDQWDSYMTLYYEDAETVMDPRDIPLYRAFNGEEVLQFEMWAEVSGSGNKQFLVVNGKPLINQEGEQTGAVVVFHDMTERKRLTDEMNRTKEQFRSLFEHNFDAVYAIDLQGNFLISNPACQQLTGYSDEEMRGFSFHAFIIGDDLQTALTNFQRAKEGITQNFEITIITKNRRRSILNVTNVPNVVNGEIIGVFGIAKDITQQKEYEKEIRHLAYYDQLTALPNRTLFRDRTLQSWKHSKKEKNLMAVLFLDLDGFKLVNDTLGHDVGDQVLIQVSKRFTQCLEVDYTLSRLGGDEFTVLCPIIMSEVEAEKVANQLLDSLKEPFVFEELQFHLSASIGISYFNGQEGIDVETMIKQADTAMYFIKDRGKADFSIYDESMDTETVKRVKLENDLRDALKKDRFILEYQPIVNVKSGEMVAVEALIRWEHEELGRISPAGFIPIAEETGLIIPLGEWVLKTACLQGKEWQEQGMSPITFSVNVSARQLQQKKKFIDAIKRILEETNWDPIWLEFEITETVLIENEESIAETLRQISLMGIRISIDDFGTGYSSMSHLKTFDVNTLKIDRSFILDVHSDETSKAIVKSIMTLANQLQLNTIAEGIENQEQLKLVSKENCKEVQGYYYSPPVPPDQIKRKHGDGSHASFIPADML